MSERRRHCWVISPEDDGGPWPGLVLEWRRLPSGEWAARVLYVPHVDADASIQEWFPAAVLRPHENDEPPTKAQQAAARYGTAGGV